MTQLNSSSSASATSTTVDDTKKTLVSAYVADQLAAVRHTLNAIAQHGSVKDMKEYTKAQSVLNRLAAILRHQADALEIHLEREFGGKGIEGTLKDAVTNVSGFLAGIYGKVRSDPASRMLRDDITATNFLATCYSMLYATAVSFEQEKTAILASTHLRQLTPIIIELSRVVPLVVVEELSRDGYTVNQAAFQEGMEEIAAAWHVPSVGQM